MCTVTLHRGPEGLLVTMNRDEARVRDIELPPSVERREGLPAWLAPRDRARGGTWMGVNECGLAACLLNRYDAAGPDAAAAPDAPSRGEIVPKVLAWKSLEAAGAWIEAAFDPAPYPPFTLVAASLQGARQYDWAGSGKLASAPIGSGWHMISSSFFDTAEVLAYRARKFDDWLASGAPFEGVLPAIHLQCDPGNESASILMSRPVSCTRSITQVWIPAAAPPVVRYGPVIDGAVSPASWTFRPAFPLDV